MALWKNRSVSEIEIDAAACTDIGRVRRENQDAYGSFPVEKGASLFLVADGMGGHADGREASHVAVEAVRQTFFDTSGAPADRLRAAFEEANAQIFRKADGRRGTDRMGTTCTALVILDGQVTLAHVGDSRTYRARDGRIEQLTIDHTVVGEMHRKGMLTDAEAESHPQRHAISRAMGLESRVDVDVHGPMVAQPGDRYLLCSDGLAPVPTETLSEIVLTCAPRVACERLVEEANAGGGHDNVTCLIVSISARS